MNQEWTIETEAIWTAFTSGLCLFSALFMLSLGLAPVVFGPLVLDQRLSHGRIRFGILDLLVLMVHLQFLAAAVCLLESTFVRVWVVCTLGPLICVWWGMAVIWISRLSIRNNRDRIWFVGIVAPCGFLAATFAPFALVGPVVMILYLRCWATGVVRYPFDSMFVTNMCIASLIECFALWFCWRECGKLARKFDHKNESARSAATESRPKDVS